MQKSDMSELLKVFFLQWQFVSVTPMLVEIWLDAFPNVSKDILFLAMRRVLKIHDKGSPPTIAAVSRCLEEMQSGQSQTPDRVWGLLLECVARFGFYQENLALEHCNKVDPTLAQIISRFGWRNICAWDVGDHGMYRAQVWKAHQALDSRTRLDRIAPIDERVKQLANETAAQLDMNSAITKA